ncbi:MAG: thioredoxin family protein [Tannerellaceae bacterium]|nr:thioredoxin family protein [Tannerellaceae bacterium]
MKVKTCVLVGTTVLLYMSAASKDVNMEGLSPGDRAPRIKSLGNERNFNFRNHSNRYTLLNFWATYNAESRVRNIKLSNEVGKISSGKIALCSISLDESESVFSETIRIDKLDETTQFHETEGKNSKLYRTYNLKKGFSNFLIDEKGVIVAKNITPDELAKMD